MRLEVPDGQQGLISHLHAQIYLWRRDRTALILPATDGYGMKAKPVSSRILAPSDTGRCACMGWPIVPFPVGELVVIHK
jgi:hypothetical protein